MAFSNTWSNAVPLDSQDANLLGADIRQLRLDIEERMNSGFCVDFTADPLAIYAPRYIQAEALQTFALLAGLSTQIVIAIPGALVGDSTTCCWKGDGAFQGMLLTLNAYISAADVATVTVNNPNDVDINVAAETLRVAVLRPLP